MNRNYIYLFASLHLGLNLGLLTTLCSLSCNCISTKLNHTCNAPSFKINVIFIFKVMNASCTHNCDIECILLAYCSVRKTTFPHMFLSTFLLPYSIVLYPFIVKCGIIKHVTSIFLFLLHHDHVNFFLSLPSHVMRLSFFFFHS